MVDLPAYEVFHLVTINCSHRNRRYIWQRYSLLYQMITLLSGSLRRAVSHSSVDRYEENKERVEAEPEAQSERLMSISICGYEEVRRL